MKKLEIPITPVLIIGRASGFVAQAAMRHYGDQAVLSNNPESFDWQAKLAAIIDKSRPRVVINAAMRGNTRDLERGIGVEAAERVNIALPQFVAEKCERCNARCVTFSTGMMHDTSEWRKPAVETDPPSCDPLGVYTRQKLDAEYYLLESGWYAQETNLVLRIHQPIAGFQHPKNLLTKLLSFKSYLDQPSSFTSLESCFAVLDKLLNDPVGVFGLFHVVNEGTISHLEIARRLQLADLIKAEPQAISREKFDANIAKNGGAYQPRVILRNARLEDLEITVEPIDLAVDQAINQLAQELVPA